MKVIASSKFRSVHKKSAFTLLELLLVVAILAVVGGLVIAAYDGLIGQAAKGTSANTLSSLDSSVRTYNALERSLPDDLESLLAVGVSTGTTTFSAGRGDNIATSYNTGSTPTVITSLNPLLSSHLGVVQLTLQQKTNLLAAGIDSIRYLDQRGEGAGGTLDLRAADGSEATVGPIFQADLPTQLFDVPLPTTQANRGRGFSCQLRNTPATFLPHVAYWLPGTGGYENTKLGVPPGATLILLGVGKNSSLVSTQGDINGVKSSGRLATAPYYGDVAKSEYANYLLVINVDTTPATFVTVLDPKGGSQAENYAAGRGQ